VEHRAWVSRLPQSRDIKIWSWVLRDSEPRMTVLARTSANLPDRPLVEHKCSHEHCGSKTVQENKTYKWQQAWQTYCQPMLFRGRQLWAVLPGIIKLRLNSRHLSKKTRRNFNEMHSESRIVYLSSINILFRYILYKIIDKLRELKLRHLVLYNDYLPIAPER
jgi:hypothetical protein